MSGRLVAAMRMTFALTSKPSISTSIWLEGLLALVVPAAPGPRPGGVDGVDLVDEDDGRRVLLRLLEQVAHPAGTHASATLNISTKSEPEIEKNGAPASPATARARRVLPVPGGPYSRTPLGIFCATAWNLASRKRGTP